MKDTTPDDTVIDRLRAALEADALPRAARDYARHLLNRLSQPVRVSVLGARHSGKSELVNMFVGRRLVPKDARLPTTECVWGDSEAMTVTNSAGAVRRTEKIDLGAVSGKQAAFLRLELPAPILQRINILEVVAENAPEELEAAIDWAVRRTDIVLWCSQTFDALEQSVWSRVPDSLKDHAFLVLTKADILSAEKVLSKRVAALESVVAEEFHSLFAVATLQAIRAHGPRGIDEAMFHASGGGALTSEVLRHAERGRRADFDSAHMFLARYQIRDPGGILAETAPTAAPAPAPTVAAVPAAATPPPASAEPAVAATPKVVTKVEVSSVKVSNTEIFSDAVRFLKRRGDSLSDAAANLGEGRAKDLVDHCVQAVEHLVDLFSRDESGCEATDAFIDELAEAADLMVLMQIEAGDAPAADAVTLLLQLRRDMEMKLAA